MTVSERVEAILKASRQARNSDTELLLTYMQKSGMDLDQRQQNIFRSMATPETIRRTRQKIQEEGRYKADDEITKERKYKSQRMQQIAPGASPKFIEQTLSDGRTVTLPKGYRIAE